MKASPRGELTRFKVRAGCLRYHRLQLLDGFSLRGNATTTRRVIPTSDISTRLHTRFNGEGDFVHINTLGQVPVCGKIMERAAPQPRCAL